MIGFADKLHIAVFYAVVDHLDKMPRAVLRLSIGSKDCRLLWRLCFGKWVSHVPTLSKSRRHHGRAFNAPSSPPETPVPINKSPLLSKYCVLLLYRGNESFPVNNYVAFFQIRQKVFYHFVHRLARPNHKHNLSRFLHFG